MYIEYWRLKTKPFENACDTAMASMTAQHREALARLVYVVGEHKVGAMLSGRYGVGKSLVRQLLIERLRGMGDYMVAKVDNPLCEPQSIMQDIYDQVMGKPVSFSSQGAALRELGDAMLTRSRRGFHNVVIFEEAQLLNERDRLELIGLLTNLVDDKNRPLMTVILIGNLDFAELSQSCPSLFQRLATRWTLAPLDLDQVRSYIDDRLRAAGGNDWIFDDAAVEAIHACSDGVPRCINNICDLALYAGMTEDAVRVDADLVQRLLEKEADCVSA